MRQCFVLERQHVHTVVEHAAAVGAVERADDLEQGGLAGSAGSHNRHNLALPDGYAHISQHLQVAIGFDYVFYFNHHHKITSIPPNLQVLFHYCSAAVPGGLCPVG